MIARLRARADATQTSDRRAPDWRGLTANVGLAAASLTLVVTFAELAVRALAPQQLILKRPDVWQPADTLGWIHRAHVRTTINTGERTVQMFTDENGFRVGAAGRPPAERRVLLLGDSFMEALQVEYESSFSGLLEARLPERLGEPVAVWNTAVGAWDPPHYLLQARERLRRQQFDLVIVSLYLANDIVEWRSDRIPPRKRVEVHPLRIPKQLGWDELVNAVLYPVNDFLEVRSHLYILSKVRGRSLLVRAGLTAENVPQSLLRGHADSEAWTVTALICRDIAAAAAEYGTPSLFVLIPAPFQVHREEFVRAVRDFGVDSMAMDLEQPNRLLSAALRSHDLEFVDLLPGFQTAAEMGLRLYGRVDQHLSPQGHDVMERFLEPLVAGYLAGRRQDARTVSNTERPVAGESSASAR